MDSDWRDQTYFGEHRLRFSFDSMGRPAGGSGASGAGGLGPGAVPSDWLCEFCKALNFGRWAALRQWVGLRQGRGTPADCLPLWQAAAVCLVALGCRCSMQPGCSAGCSHCPALPMRLPTRQPMHLPTRLPTHLTCSDLSHPAPAPCAPALQALRVLPVQLGAHAQRAAGVDRARCALLHPPGCGAGAEDQRGGAVLFVCPGGAR